MICKQGVAYHDTEPPKEYTVDIPTDTTERRYVSGMFALNIHPKDSLSTGDWHSDIFYYKDGERAPQVTIGGEGGIDTNDIYGSYGVRKEPELYGVQDVYVADHVRAVLDLVYGSLQKHGEVLGMNYAIVDYFDVLHQQYEVLELAAKMESYLPDKRQKEALRKWIEGEYRAIEEENSETIEEDV